MPWWIWLLLVVWLFVALIIGVVYAALHGFRALKQVEQTGATVSDSLARMQDPLEDNSQHNTVVSQPISKTAERYSQVHEQVVRARAKRHARHAQVWQRWNNQ